MRLKPSCTEQWNSSLSKKNPIEYKHRAQKSAREEKSKKGTGKTSPKLTQTGSSGKPTWSAPALTSANSAEIQGEEKLSNEQKFDVLKLEVKRAHAVPPDPRSGRLLLPIPTHSPRLTPTPREPRGHPLGPPRVPPGLSAVSLATRTLPPPFHLPPPKTPLARRNIGLRLGVSGYLTRILLKPLQPPPF